MDQNTSPSSYYDELLKEYRKITAVSTVISGIFYGFVVALSLVAFEAVWKQKKKYTTRQRAALLTYIIVMLSSSTLQIASNTWNIVSSLDNEPTLLVILQFYLKFPSPLLVPWSVGLIPYALSIWGADALLTWRCIALFQGISKLSRAMLLAFLGLTSLASLAFGLLSFASFLINWGIFLLIASSLINLILSSLIIGRIFRIQWQINKVLGREHGKLYTRIIILCIESCAPIVLFQALYIISAFCPAGNEVQGLSYLSEISGSNLPHIYVRASALSLLLINRVARGIDTVTTMSVSRRASRTNTRRAPLDRLRFAPAVFFESGRRPEYVGDGGSTGDRGGLTLKL